MPLLGYIHISTKEIQRLYLLGRTVPEIYSITIDRKESKTATARVIIGGQSGLIRLRDLMYENDSVSLKRKKDILYAKI